MGNLHRIALISDIHGNEIALRRVLQSIAEVGADQVVCLGDVATLGVAPAEVLDMLKYVGCPCIAGNHDDYVLGGPLDDGHATTEVLRDAILWCRDALTSPQLEFVRGFEEGRDMPLGNHHQLRLFHGSPSSNLVNLLPDTPSVELDMLLGEARSTVMAGGHTHIQMLRQHQGTLLVNPGSVGAPFREYPVAAPPEILPHAEYAIVEARGHDISVMLHRVALDRLALQRAAEASKNPLASSLIQAYR
ncbi:MAG: metallophosphoesterase family protein [Polyangiales bacterium]